MGDRPLRQARGSLIAGQDVRITVFAQASAAARYRGVEPGSGADLDDPGQDVIRDYRAGQTGAARVENPDDVACIYIPGTRVIGVQGNGFAAVDLAGTTMAAMVEL